ncbi:MAG: acyl-CoA dehydratase activase [Filifactoraceae bacterium]
MNYIGIDIGSTTSKLVVMNENKEIIYKDIMPTGWSSVETANKMKADLEANSISLEASKVVATGYGRVSVSFADKTLTEISCHGRGAAFIFGMEDSLVIDVGGQDVKIISLEGGNVSDFLMNDKCSAGTGRFLEVMSNIMGVTIEDMCKLAESGKGVSISSMCTVFAESEVISLIGLGKSKEDIAFGIIDSVTDKVKTLCNKHSKGDKKIYLTGGLHRSPYIINSLSKKLERTVESSPLAQYAGAIGGAISAMKL